MICSQNIGAPFALAVHVVQRAKVALERDKQGNYCFKVNLIYRGLGKVTFANKFTSSLKTFIVKKNKIQPVFNSIYPENY